MSLPGIAQGVNTEGAYTPENLIASEYPRIVRIVTLTGAAELAAGAVLGRITADGRYQLSHADASDGSEIPDAILAETIDASAGDVQSHVFLTGEFNEALLTHGRNHTVDALRQFFRTRGVFLRRNQA